MRRGVAAIDRLASLVVGLALLAVGAGAVAWQQGHLDRVGPVLDVGWLPDTVAAAWWPWVSTIVGVVLVLLVLIWLSAHLPRRGPSTVTLTGSDGSGRLEADMRVAANRAATALAASPSIRSARSRTVTERGLDTIELVAHLEPGADLGEAVTAVDRTSADLTLALGETPPAVRARLKVGRTTGSSDSAT